MQRVQQRAQRLLAVVLAAVAQLGAQRQRREAAQQVDGVSHAVVVARAQLRRARPAPVSRLSLVLRARLTVPVLVAIGW